MRRNVPAIVVVGLSSRSSDDAIVRELQRFGRVYSFSRRPGDTVAFVDYFLEVDGDAAVDQGIVVDGVWYELKYGKTVSAIRHPVKTDTIDDGSTSDSREQRDFRQRNAVRDIKPRVECFYTEGPDEQMCVQLVKEQLAEGMNNSGGLGSRVFGGPHRRDLAEKIKAKYGSFGGFLDTRPEFVQERIEDEPNKKVTLAPPDVAAARRAMLLEKARAHAANNHVAAAAVAAVTPAKAPVPAPAPIMRSVWSEPPKSFPTKSVVPKVVAALPSLNPAASIPPLTNPIELAEPAKVLEPPAPAAIKPRRSAPSSAPAPAAGPAPAVVAVAPPQTSEPKVSVRVEVASLVACGNCLSPNLPRFNFCNNCGAKRLPPTACVFCFFDNLPGFQFCSNCGKKTVSK